MFTKVNRKSLEVEAAQWDGTASQAAEFVVELVGSADYFANTNELRIKGPQGVWLPVTPNDWIIKSNGLTVVSPADFMAGFEGAHACDKKEKKKEEPKKSDWLRD